MMPTTWSLFCYVNYTFKDVCLSSHLVMPTSWNLPGYENYTFKDVFFFALSFCCQTTYRISELSSQYSTFNL